MYSRLLCVLSIYGLFSALFRYWSSHARQLKSRSIFLLGCTFGVGLESGHVRGHAVLYAVALTTFTLYTSAMRKSETTTAHTGSQIDGFVCVCSHMVRVRAPNAAVMAARMSSDAKLRESGSQIGIDAQDLQERPRTAFQLAKDERDEIVNMRMSFHERQRKQLAKELQDHHENVTHLSKKLSRVISTKTLRTSQSSASCLNMVAADAKRLEALRAARTPQSDEWYESKHLEAQESMQSALSRYESHMERQRASRQILQDHRDRARYKLYQMEHELFENGEKRRSMLDARLTRAASCKDKISLRHEREQERQRAREEKRSRKREEAKQHLQEERDERHEALLDSFERQQEQLQKLHNEREMRIALAAEKARLVEMDHLDRQHRLAASKHVEASFVRAKHEHVDKKLQALREEKQDEMERRRAASVRSSQVRQAIIVSNATEWKDLLRWTPPAPDLLEEAGLRPPPTRQSSRADVNGLNP